MSADPQWTSYLTSSTVWNCTESNLQLWHAFDADGHALCNRRIRAHGHRDWTWFRTLADAEAFPLSNIHDRCRAKAEAKVASHPEAQKRAAEDAAWEAELAEEKRQDQRATAAFIFGETCYTASYVVTAFQANADDTVAEGGPQFTPAEIWAQIGDVLGDYGPDAMAHYTEERTPVAALIATWNHVDDLAVAGTLSGDRENELIAEARAVLAAATAAATAEDDDQDDEQPETSTGVTLAKNPRSWQVLLHTDSPLTGARWADLPLHSVVPAEQLCAGQDWHAVDQQLTARGLTRYGFPHAMSAGHALDLARKRWEAKGPRAAWFAFLREEAPAIEAMRAEYAPTPEHERAAFEFATAAVAHPAPLTLAELRAIANGTA
ncbi:hypothetical protein [Streptomyces tirandamycinicus]|uniref:Uncharacterized protein n=1 Tax=Streptomyces tirandamycinicus TaxID=2174846 RepID=A0A2S1T1U8_9ACTN|nr:hypothetical protein [Streptomyces tirandamycinicus]AWI32639.1 hypothetical protein DDW44_30435 [Streptomyces tirandamycinicus]